MVQGVLHASQGLQRPRQVLGVRLVGWIGWPGGPAGMGDWTHPTPVGWWNK